MVDQERFEQAEQAYRQGDWRAAAQAFLAAAQDGGEGSARAYAKAGTALSRMQRWSDAVAVYRHALADPEYATRGVVWANLGAALLETAEYGEALSAYDRSLEDPAYDTRWRALQGRAGALAALGRHAEAAASYRESALDPRNTDPGKALNNLGLQFMELDRPEDAVEAYRATLELPDYTGRGRAMANLATAYDRLGLHERAAETFAAAEAEGFLVTGESAEAQAASAAAVAPAGITPVTAGIATAEPTPDAALASGAPPATPETATPAVAPAAPTESDQRAGAPGGPSQVPGGEAGLDTDFFDLTDDDMRRIDQERQRERRAEPRSRRGLWSAIAATVLLLALVAGLVAAVLLTGFGWPTQQDVTKNMLDSYRAGKPVDVYWVAVPPADIDREMARIPPTFKSVQIGTAKNTSLLTARMNVSVTIENGSPLDYVVSLEREGVGWRVAGIDNDFRSSSSTP